MLRKNADDANEVWQRLGEYLLSAEDEGGYAGLAMRPDGEANLDWKAEVPPAVSMFIGDVRTLRQMHVVSAPRLCRAAGG